MDNFDDPIDNGVDDLMPTEVVESNEVSEVELESAADSQIADGLAPAEIVESDDTSQVTLDTSDSQIADELQIQSAVESLQQMESLDPETWQSLDSAQRLECLQNIEDRMAEIQGRPSVQISTDTELGPTTFGGWDGVGIRINAAHLSGDMAVDEFVNTIVHEGRHAYQDYAIQNPGFVSDEGTVNSWADNRVPGHYLFAEDYGQEIYMAQPLEADAWRYADRVINAHIASQFGKIKD